MTGDEATELVLRWASEQRSAVVVTPNVDHLVLLDRDPAFQSAYRAADLQLCDGMPLKLLASLAGTPVPQRVTGADLFVDVCRGAAREGLRVFVAGGQPDVLERALAALRAQFPGLDITGHSPPYGFEGTPAESELRRRITEARPHIVAVCLSAPRSEIWAVAQSDRHCAVYLCVGAAVDFAAGAIHRAPVWIQRAGLEWVYRLVQEPGRLWRRYLVRDLAFLGVAARHLTRH